jgi:hypothetical protein
MIPSWLPVRMKNPQTTALDLGLSQAMPSLCPGLTRGSYACTSHALLLLSLEDGQNNLHFRWISDWNCDAWLCRTLIGFPDRTPSGKLRLARFRIYATTQSLSKARMASIERDHMLQRPSSEHLYRNQLLAMQGERQDKGGLRTTPKSVEGEFL